MGLIMHRSKLTEDSVVILGAAVDHDKGCPTNHFILANALAVVGDFNSSLKHYDACLKLNPLYDLPGKYRNAVKCHVHLVDRMQIVHE